MRNPNNAAADVLDGMSLSNGLYEITRMDPNADNRWIVRLALKSGMANHPLADAVFIVQEIAASGVVVRESDETPSTAMTRRFCERMVVSLTQSDE